MDDKQISPVADMAIVFSHNKDGWLVAIPLRQERTLDLGEAIVSPVTYESLAIAMAATIVYLERSGQYVQ